MFARWPIEAVVHFAAKKAVGESVAQPLDYYANNVGGTDRPRPGDAGARLQDDRLQLHRHRLRPAASLPVREDAALAPSNPYGATKLMSENILRDVERADPAWRIALLRYFNPVGAHPSGTIGEDPRGTPNNLMPFVAQVAVGKRPKLQVFGNDYETPDGSGVRDYLHVQDLAEGHVAALKHLLGGGESLTLNLGTGRGVSVLELVRAFERGQRPQHPLRDRAAAAGRRRRLLRRPGPGRAAARLAGPAAAWTRCAPTAGAGRRPTRTATRPPEPTAGPPAVGPGPLVNPLKRLQLRGPERAQNLLAEYTEVVTCANRPNLLQLAGIRRGLSWVSNSRSRAGWPSARSPVR